MLKSWSIENFKPIVNSEELKLAPVTVFAGLNSSGKSSLLQSILMISQTLSNRVLDRPLVPNGAIVQLGTFENIINKISWSRILTVSFELEIEKEERAPVRRRLMDGRLATSRLGIKSSKVTARFFSPDSNGMSSSAIEAAKVAVNSVSIEIDAGFEPLTTVTQYNFLRTERRDSLKSGIVFERVADTELRQFLRNVAQDYLRLVPYSGEQPNYLGRFSSHDEKVGAGISDQYLIALSHFLPARLIGKFKIEVRRKQRLERAVNLLFDYPDNSASLHQLSEFFEPETLITEGLRKSLVELFVEKNITENFTAQTLLDLVRWFKLLKVETRGGKKGAIGKKIREAIVQSFIQDPLKSESETDKDSEGLESIANNLSVESLEQSVEQITNFFTSKIRYLGPLRADSQASQKFAPSSELDDIGAKGEYAAAVYDANQNARIKWYNPSSDQIEQDSLKVALDTWARYLGVAHQIKIETGGQSGVSWQVVHLEGQELRSLSAVGFGVSQILPILVMGLMAPSSTLLIIEQPEVHLHPRIQSRLGDFFVGLAKCNKQCLIETHSENLINQLRYQIVRSGGQDKSDCIIYFVDQDEKGAAKFEPVEISPKGNILNWPEGFFDETMQQEDRITAESIKRRANVARNG